MRLRDVTNPDRTTVPTWLPVDLAGNPLHDFFSTYHIADQPTTAQQSDDIRYYGYLAVDGRWYILRSQDSTGAFRFAAGLTDYATNYANCASLTYDYINHVF